MFSCGHYEKEFACCFMVHVVFYFKGVPGACIYKYQVFSPYRYLSCSSEPRSLFPVRLELGGLVKIGSFGLTLPSTVVLMASRRTSLMLFEFLFAYSSRSLCSASVRVVCTTFMLHHEWKMNDEKYKLSCILASVFSG